MKDIIVVCAGAFGHEVLSVIHAINLQAVKNGLGKKYNVLGFIDDNPNDLDGKNESVSIIGKISDWQPIGDEVYTLGISSPALKEKITRKLKEKGCKFETLIAPWSLVSNHCKMGEGCFITAYSISAGVTLGDFVGIHASMICPGTTVGDYSTTTGFAVVDDAKIGKRVFVGSHVVIMPGVTVGDDVQVSVGSIVRENIPAGSTVFGVPAVRIG